MTWIVVWNRTQLSKFRSTYDELLQGDPNAAERVAQALAAIDRLFERSPEKTGESRGEFERLVIESPLSITFEVHPEEQIVYVIRFQYLAR